MREKIKIGEIKKALEHNKKLATEAQGGYNKEEDEWTIYDSSIEKFGKTFESCLPVNNTESITETSGETFKEYIENTLSDNKKDLFAVEFGGPGSNLFRGFTPDFFKKTAGICLKDIRDLETKEIDTQNKHAVIESDVLDIQSNALFDNIKDILGTEKVDLIISRMVGALWFIDQNPAILDRIVRNWYEILNKNGLMFIEFFPYNNVTKLDLQEIIEKWAVAIKEKLPNIDIQVGNGIRLHKKINAPEKLPSAIKLLN